MSDKNIQKKQVSLQLVAVIDGKIIPIRTADYSETINSMIEDGDLRDNEKDIVEYLQEEFYQGEF